MAALPGVAEVEEEASAMAMLEVGAVEEVVEVAEGVVVEQVEVADLAAVEEALVAQLACQLASWVAWWVAAALVEA